MTIPFVQGILSGSRSLTPFYTWPSHLCTQEEDKPDVYSNVGAYAKDIWETIRKNGGHECQTGIKV